MASSSAETPSSPVRALRASFGDPKPPDISRKITACVACRKQKIKCHMGNDAQPPCVRCRKRGLQCTVNRSLQMLLESDTSWKHAMEAKIRDLEAKMERFAAEGHHHPIAARESSPHGDTTSTISSPVAPPDNRNHRANGTRPGPQEHHHGDDVVMSLDSDPSSIPGFSISPANPTTLEPHPKKYQDPISRGIIPLDKAETFFREYRDRLDHFPYRILGDHGAAELDTIRRTSPLLTSAMCTVGALHLASDDFDACHKDFVEHSATTSFSRAASTEDVQALCIGAFWLSDLSWALSGAAVRIATELQLHKSWSKVMQGDRAHYLRTRLYLLVYACDHHFSVAFGRPPMTRESDAVRNARRFLDCRHATEDDARLVSQVCRWSVCTDVFDALGPDVGVPLADAEVPRIRRFGVALDALRAEFAERFVVNAHVGNYPRKGVGLQYHFAKLYLYSHVFRGSGGSRGSDSAGPGTGAGAGDVAFALGTEREEMAHAAVASALSILRVIVADAEIQSFLTGLPAYFDTMIAFAVVFLVKVSTSTSAGRAMAVKIHVDRDGIRRQVSELVGVLERVTETMHPRHLLVRITKGIAGLMRTCGMAMAMTMTTGADRLAAHEPLSEDASHFPPPDLGTDERLQTAGPSGGIDDTMLDAQFMGEFDFLLNEDFEMPFSLDVT